MEKKGEIGEQMMIHGGEKEWKEKYRCVKHHHIDRCLLFL